jgi:hypothetical protein
MSVDVRVLRRYAPALVLLGTIGAGWMIFVRPVSAEQGRAASQLQSLRQREMALRRETGEPAPPGVDLDPTMMFERQVAAGNVSPAVLEQLAHLAATARARSLLIETVESGPATINAPPRPGPAEAGHVALQRDPRFSLFETPVTHVPIRMVFDTAYPSLGRFFWTFRNLPTAVEIRTVSIGLPPRTSDDEAGGVRTDVVRASLMLHAYSRSGSEVDQAAHSVLR